MKPDTLEEIVLNLAKSESEGTFYEFKVDYHEPEKIGEYISALSNSALLADEPYGYLIYGIQDKTHEIVGTKFNPKTEKGKGNEDLEPWLRRLLTPRIGFEIIDLQINEKRIVVFQIPAAEYQPTSFKSTRYVRINSYNKPIDEYPDLEKKLWKELDKRRFESEIAFENISKEEIDDHIFTDEIFKYLKEKVPDTSDGKINRLIEEGFIVRTGKTFSLTNLGAILFAKKLDRYPHISRKKLRIISYNSPDRIYAKDEWEFNEGYAVTLVKAMEKLKNELPSNEIIKDVIRKEVMMYPEIAIREFLANALIHQDFWISGTSPVVEIFPKRLEITNPGCLLVSLDRLINCTPRSRNETLARMMRRMGFCEERGSGIDRAINEIELYQLPAPEFKEDEDSFHVIMYSYRSLGEMDMNDKIRACYQHCCLCYVKKEYMTNTSLRNRLGIDDKNYPIASKILKKTLEKNLIKIYNNDGSNNSAKYRKYIPYWD